MGNIVGKEDKHPKKDVTSFTEQRKERILNYRDSKIQNNQISGFKNDITKTTTKNESEQDRYLHSTYEYKTEVKKPQPKKTSQTFKEQKKDSISTYKDSNIQKKQIFGFTNDYMNRPKKEQLERDFPRFSIHEPKTELKKQQPKKPFSNLKEQRKLLRPKFKVSKIQQKQNYRLTNNSTNEDASRTSKIRQDWPLYERKTQLKKQQSQKPLKPKDEVSKIKRKKNYEFTHDDAKQLSKKGFKQGQPLYSIKECKEEMIKQLSKLNTDYEYDFDFKESLQPIKNGKKMTRTIYLKFQCNDCKTNQWTTIAGTFEVTFQYENFNKSLQYYVRIYGSDCRKCEQVMIPSVYQTQMEAMKIFFSVILTNILDNKPPPQRPQKYYIRENHWHKKQWCEACKQGNCTTQRR